jgi:hypothetical protein
VLAEWRRELAWMGLGALATGFATALCQWGVDELKRHVEKKREEELFEIEREERKEFRAWKKNRK